MLRLITGLVAIGAALGAPTESTPANAKSVIEKRNSVSGTANVALNIKTGVNKNLASGFIYGIPDTANQIPDHFYTDFGFNFGRAGGAQTPSTGWLGGPAQYTPRFTSTLSNYKTCRKYGASFNILLHDLWGADTTEPDTAIFPGDNGNWTTYDAFLTQLISDIKKNNMTPGLVIDIWNEPDGYAFWKRSQAQWIQMWGRCYYRFKKDLPSVLTSGPSLAGAPDPGNTWWTNWASFIAQNGSAPTQYSWHMEGGGGDMVSSTATYKSILATYGLATNHVVNINEYATYDEQTPSGGAWWISQLERVNAIGLRGNWLSAAALHDFAAGLLGKPNAGTSSYSATGTGYWPAAEFQVYKYYKNMTGQRLQTTPTADTNGEVFAVLGTDRVKLLVGARIATGTWTITLSNLTSLGLPAAGSLPIHTYTFGGSSNHFQEYDSPADFGVYSHVYSGNSVSFDIYSQDVYTANAFEFSLKAGVSV